MSSRQRRQDPRADFRRRLASSLSLAEPLGGSSAGSVSSASTSAALQPPPSGLGSLGRGSTAISTTPGPGLLSVGGLGGKFGAKLGTVVKLSPMSNICGGVIKSSEVFRMCTSSSCSVLSHQRNKSDAFPSAPTFFIQPKGMNSVLPEPTLVERECSEEMLDTLRSNEKLTVDEWISIFTDFLSNIEEQKMLMLSSLSIKSEGSVDESMEEYDIGPLGNERKYDPITKIEEQETPMFSNLDEENDSGIAFRAITNIVTTLNEVGVVLEMVDLMMNDSCVDFNTLRQQFVTLNGLTKDIEKTIGDAKYIKEEFGSITNALHALVAQGEEAASTIDVHRSNFVNMQQDVEDLIIEANGVILDKFKELSRQVSNSVGSNLSGMVTTSMIFDGHGSLNPDLSVGEVDGQVFTLRDLVRKVLSLDADVNDLSAKIKAKGGVTIGNLYFPSYENLVDIIKSENPSANSIQCFVDAQLLFGHVKSLSAREQKDTASLNSQLSVTDSTLIDIATAPYPLIEPYTGAAKDYTPGASIDCFKSDAVWSGAGHSAGQGREAKIADQARRARRKVEQVTLQRLKTAPTLLALANEMVKRSEDWHLELHKYFTAEQSVLGALKLPNDDIFQLFSEVFQLIAESWQVHRSGVHVAGDNSVDPVERMATYIWSTLKVHEIMEEYVLARFKHHSIIQSAFVRFLTRKTGENTAAALAVKFASLEKEMKTVKEAGAGVKRDCVTLTKRVQNLSDNHDTLVRKNDLKK